MQHFEVTPLQCLQNGNSKQYMENISITLFNSAVSKLEAAATGKSFPGTNSTFRSAKATAKDSTIKYPQGSLQPVTAGYAGPVRLATGILPRWMAARTPKAGVEVFCSIPGGTEGERKVHTTKGPGGSGSGQTARVWQCLT